MATIKPDQNDAGINTGQPVPGPARIDITGPDLGPGSVVPTPPTFATEGALIIPDFDKLTPEEREKWMALYRFHGIRLRPDHRGKIVPISRETLDL